MGLVTADSIDSEYEGGYSETKTGIYQYTGNTISASIHHIDISPGSPVNDFIETDTAQTDDRGNIVSNIKHSQGDQIQSTITWDTQPSPFAKLSNFRTFFVFPFGETFFNDLSQHNNRLHITEVTTGLSTNVYDDDLSGKYIYNAAGYPVQISETDPASPGTTDKTIFVYKSV